MVHTLVSYIHGQCLNPWNFDVDHQMHSADPTDIDAVREFAKSLRELYQHVTRLGDQLYRAYFLIFKCK